MVTFHRSQRFQSTNRNTQSVPNLRNSSPFTNSPTFFTLLFSKSRPVSFFTISPNFPQNRRDPRSSDCDHDGPSGSAAAETRNRILLRRRGTVKVKTLGFRESGGGEETRRGLGLRGMVSSIASFWGSFRDFGVYGVYPYHFSFQIINIIIK